MDGNCPGGNYPIAIVTESFPGGGRGKLSRGCPVTMQTPNSLIQGLSNVLSRGPYTLSLLL